MSKKDGTLFSTSLFGYKKSDVNDYIKRSDASHADQIYLLRSENDRLLIRAMNAEARAAELEKIIARSENCTKAPQADRETESAKTTAKGKRDSIGASSHHKADASHKRTSIFGAVKKK
jgi:hypothetical protein